MSILKTLDAQSDSVATPLTQKQIADELGVSRQLVGFALRGQGRMTDEVRERILQLARSNGYHQYSNSEARQLAARRYGKRARSGIVAVVFKSTFEEQPVTSLPYFAAFFQGLEAEAIARELDLVLCALRPHDLPRLVRERQVDGVVGLLTPQSLARDVAALELPVVNVLYGVPGALNLLIDDQAAMRDATLGLLNSGHRRVAYIGIERARGQERLSGYQNALQLHKIEREPRLIQMTNELPSVEGGAQAMRHLLVANAHGKRPGFDGLVCYNDLLAMGAIQVLREHGYGVPDDVSIVGFDDVSAQYGFQPALTSVGHDRQLMGRRAIELLDQATSDEQAPAGDELFPTQLIERASTRPFQPSL